MKCCGCFHEVPDIEPDDKGHIWCPPCRGSGQAKSAYSYMGIALVTPIANTKTPPKCKFEPVAHTAARELKDYLASVVRIKSTVSRLSPWRNDATIELDKLEGLLKMRVGELG